MRSVKWLVAVFFLSSLLAVDGAHAGGRKAAPLDAEVPPDPLNCMIPNYAYMTGDEYVEFFCDLSHCPWDPNNEWPDDCADLTGYCGGLDCFEMSQGDEVRVVATDDQGYYPLTWFLWPEGAISPVAPEPLQQYPCEVDESGNKFRVEIPFPPPPPKCTLKMEADDHLYYEHFAANQTKACLAWLECRVDVTAP